MLPPVKVGCYIAQGQKTESFSFKKLTNLFLTQYETLVERIIH